MLKLPTFFSKKYERTKVKICQPVTGVDVEKFETYALIIL